MAEMFSKKFMFLVFVTLFSALSGDENPPAHLRAIVFCDHPRYDTETLEGVHVKGLTIRGSKLAWGSFQKDLQSRFLNQALTIERIEEIRKAITIYYADVGYPFTRVIIPPQDVTCGDLQVVIVEGELGEVHFCENRWLRPWVLRQGWHSQVGRPIDMNVLNADLAYLNRNPFRQTNAIFSPGEDEGTTDIKLITTAKRPIRVYGGIDDRGNEAIGIMRQYYGASCGNFLGVDHVISYQLTTSLDSLALLAHAGYYEIPIPYRQSLVFLGGYSRIRDGEVGAQMRNEGHNIQASTRYHVPLFATGRHYHDFSVGFDFKETNNNALFSEMPIFVNIVNLSQFLVSYQYQMEWQTGGILGNLDFYFSPATFFSKQTVQDFDQLTPGARPKYYYLHADIASRMELGKNWDLYLRFWGQIANQNLLPSEQLGLGGFDTVRGYKEREINGDNGLFSSLEVLAAPFSLINRKNKSYDAMTLLAFIDYGWVRPHRQVTLDNQPLREGSQYILGIGPGARYTIGTWLSFVSYWGFRFHHSEDDNSHGGRVNFNLTLSY